MTLALPPLPASAYTSLSQFLPLTGIKLTRDIEAAYAWIRALRNVGMAAADVNYIDYPRGNFPITGGTITSATATTLSDSANTTTSPKRCGKPQPYNGCYVAIFYKDDPRYIAYANITSATTTSGLVMTIAQDWIARGIVFKSESLGWVVSTESYAGSVDTSYAPSQDICHYMRWPTPPNATEFVGNPTLALTGLPGSLALFPTSKLTISGPPTGGTFTITVNSSGSQTTGNIAYNALVSDVQTAIQGLSNVGGGKATVVKNTDGTLAIAFDPTLTSPTVSVTSSLVGGTITATTISLKLLDVTQTWQTSQWTTAQPTYPESPASFDLVVLDDGANGDSLVRRFPITANDGTTITIGSLGGWTPSLNCYYSVVKTRGYWCPRRLSSRRTLWYSGATDSSIGLTHMPDDSINGYPVAALDVSYDPGDSLGGGACNGDIPQIVFDTDTWNDCCDIGCCSLGNKSFNPDLWKSDRQIQLSIIAACGLPWIQNDWSGGHAPPLPLTFPIACRGAAAAGSDVNSFSASIVSLSSDHSKAYIGVTTPYPEPLLYYTLIRADGTLDYNGTAVVQTDGTGAYITGEWSPDQVGESMICTYGFSNAHFYAVKYPNAKTVWIPSLTVDAFGNAVVVDPPTVTGGPTVKPSIGQQQVVQSGGQPINISSLTQTGGTATVVCSQPHSLTSSDYAVISGANPSGYIGTYPVTIVDASTFTVPVDPSLASPASAASGYSYPQFQKFSGAYDISATLAISHTGSCLVAFGAIGKVVDPGAGAISDSQGQTWTYLGYVNPDSGGGGSGSDPGSVGCWYCVNALPGTTKVKFYPAGGGNILTLCVLEVIGADAGTPIDAYSSAGSSSTGNPASSSLTTSAANDLLISFATFSDVAATWTVQSGYTMAAFSSDIDVCAYALESQLATTAGTYNNGFSINHNQPATCWSLAIKQGTQSSFLGFWQKRAASTNYMRYDQGYGSPSDGGPAFAAGDLAEVLFDNAADPTLPGLTPSNVMTAYNDHRFVGVNGATVSNPIYEGFTPPNAKGQQSSTGIDSQGTGLGFMSGAVTSFANSGGATTQISVPLTTKTNWLQYWYSANLLMTALSGTCTGGSASTLVDSSASFSPDPNGCPTRLWGCTAQVSHTSGGVTTTTNFLINGVGLTANTLNVVPDPGGATIHAGDTYYIEVPNGLMRVDHGVVTSGSSTSMTDSALAGDARFAPGMFDSGFTLKVFHPDGTGAQTCTKHYVTGATKATATLTFAATDSVSVSSGDLYELDWPRYELSRFQGLWVDVTTPTATYAAEIVGNDQNTLFLQANGWTLPTSLVGVTFKIETFLPGSVVKRDPTNTRWLSTYGQTEHRTDPYAGSKPAFHRDLRENLPFRFDWYGVINCSTLVSTQTINQMFAVMEQFKTQRRSPFWISQADPSVPENNSISAYADTGQYDWVRGTPTPSGCTLIIYDSNCNYTTDKESARNGYQTDIDYYLGGGASLGLTCQPSGFGPPSGGRSLSETPNGTAPSKYSHGAYSESSACGPTFDPDNFYCGCCTVGGLEMGTDGNHATYAYARIEGLNYNGVTTATFYNYATFAVTTYSAVVDPDALAAGFYECVVTGADYFDSSGDPVAYNSWTEWDSEGISGGDAQSNKLGSLVVIDTPILPSAPAEPSTNFQVDGSINCGYTVTDVLCTVDYSLPSVS